MKMCIYGKDAKGDDDMIIVHGKDEMEEAREEIVDVTKILMIGGKETKKELPKYLKEYQEFVKKYQEDA